MSIALTNEEVDIRLSTEELRRRLERDLASARTALNALEPRVEHYQWRIEYITNLLSEIDGNSPAFSDAPTSPPAAKPTKNPAEPPAPTAPESADADGKGAG